MLFRFSCSNFFSIRDAQELSLIADRTVSDRTLFNIPGSNLKALPCAAIYGANASGKSNFLNAIDFARSTIVNSHARFAPDRPISYSIFSLDKKAANEVSQFEFDFDVSGVRYSYGFSILSGFINTEFLYAYPQGHKQSWFVRDNSAKKKFKFSKYLKGKNAIVADLTRANSLFLSAAAQQNHDQLTPIFEFFGSRLKFFVDHDSSHLPHVAKLLDGPRREWILEFLKGADFGINDFKLEKEKPAPKFESAMRNFLVELAPNEEEKKKVPATFGDMLRPKLGHPGKDNEIVYLPWHAESAGTQRLLELLGPTLDVLETGGVAVIDELDASLHTEIAKSIVRLFKDIKMNTNGAQLLFTTHDTNLLCSGDLNRDEIWFSEKSPFGETVIYPLSDFKVRDTDNFEKGYLQGRFGAVPFVGKLKNVPK